MIDGENWNSEDLQKEFGELNKTVSEAVSKTADVTHSPLQKGPNGESGAVEYSLKQKGLLVEVYRALPQGRLIKITEQTVEDRQVQAMTSQGEKTVIDIVPVTQTFRIYPNGRWSLEGNSRSALFGEATSWSREIPPQKQTILDAFGLDPMRDAYLRAGVRRTREIVKQLTERR